MTGKPWPEDLVKFAIQKRKDGLSATDIATEIYRRFGVSKTRNMVIGVLHRRGATAEPKSLAAMETQRQVQRVKAIKAAKTKPAPPRPTLQRTTTPVVSPNARHWTLRCDGIDSRECAYLVDGATTACCNPVDGGPGTFRQRYCTGHLGVVLDVEATAKYARRIPFAYEPSSVRRVPVVNGRATGWDSARMKS